MIRSLFFCLTIIFTGCTQSEKINWTNELDLEYPSILGSSFEHVKNNITATWTGNRSLLSDDTLKGKYELEIKFNKEEFFTIIERKTSEPGKGNKKLIIASLITIDDRYVFDVVNERIIPIHYLSEKQLKLNDLIFERVIE